MIFIIVRRDVEKDVKIVPFFGNLRRFVTLIHYYTAQSEPHVHRRHVRHRTKIDITDKAYWS